MLGEMVQRQRAAREAGDELGCYALANFARPPAGRQLTTRHLERLAMVYVRQSTLQQMVRHQESTRLQYALVEHAQELDFPARAS